MTQEEKRLIGLAAMDIETGHYLLYKRDEDLMKMIYELLEAIHTPDEERTDRMREIYEEYRLNTDFTYWLAKEREKKNKELGEKIADAWNTISSELAMKSDDGKFMMSDVQKAFTFGVDTVLLHLGVIDKIGGEYTEKL